MREIRNPQKIKSKTLKGREHSDDLEDNITMDITEIR